MLVGKLWAFRSVEVPMTSSAPLLFEIGTEELPPKALQRLADALLQGLVDGLDKVGLTHGESHVYAAPRRLAVHIEALAARQPDRHVERRGPAVQAAFDDAGQPTPAALGFARSCAVDIDALQRLVTDKGEWLLWQAQEAGKGVAELLPEILTAALDRLPIPRRMRWGAGEETFVRPVHWLVLLYGHEVLPFSAFGHQAGRLSFGHRFHHPQAISLSCADDYVRDLEVTGQVMVDRLCRRQSIRQQVEAQALAAGGKAVINEALLDEVTGMNEWPVAVRGDFDRRFLELPAEVLISAMGGHQKYFHVVDSDGQLLPVFITVSNIASRDMEIVREGNERVIRPRLSDAAFFWQQDRAQPLAARVDALARVLFQKQLGTLQQKTVRLVALSSFLARQLALDVSQVERAALLAKCDLLTDMVAEFPELQGLMGRYYAAADGEDSAVATALEEQYHPRHAGDSLPRTDFGRVLALADKIDTLVGIFALGQQPTGDRDPFALRRAALGVLRILVEEKLPLTLAALIDASATTYRRQDITVDAAVAEDLYVFFIDRLRGYCLDQGIGADVFAAVRACKPLAPADFVTRLQAVTAFRQRPEAAGLAAANKRIRNLLRKSGVAAPLLIEEALFVEGAEKNLYEVMSQLTADVAPMLAAGRYREALARLAQLHEPVDVFFEHVMVMVEDDALRANRLALLQALSALFLEVADISLLQQAG